MKNFTNNFKQFTSRLSARWLIMALMMLVGTSSAWAWTVYYDNSATKWSTVYLVIGNDSYRRGNYTMTKVSGYDNLYSYTATDWTDAKYVAFSSTSIAASNSSLTGLGIPYYIFDANMTNANNKIFGGTAYVSDKAQLVLNDYIGFYIGEPTSWNQSIFFIWKTENSKNSYQAGGNTAETQGSNKLQIVYAKSGTYSLTHSASWAGVSTGAVKAGYGYYIGNGNAMKTLTPTTAPSYTFNIQTPISQGSTSTVSNETANGKSMYGTKTVALDSYYIQKNGESTFTKLTKSGTALQTQNLSVGTYQVIPIIYDGKIYFKGTPQTLVIEEACPTPAQPELSSSAVFACKGAYQSMGYVIIENMDDYQDDTYTFKLGSSTVTPAADGKLGINSIAYTNYTVTVTNSCGQPNSNNVDIEIKDNTPTMGSFTVTGNSPICSGNKATLTANVTPTKGTIDSYSWSPSNGTKNENKYTTPALTQNTSYLGQVKLVYEGCEKTFSATSYTVQVRTAPSVPTPTVTKATLCNGTLNYNGSITITPADGVTYTLIKEGNTYPATNNSSWSGLAPGTYTLTATLDACQDLSNSAKIEVEADDITPVVETLTMPANFSSCDGQLVQGIALQNWEEAVGYTYTYQWQSSANGTSFTNMGGMTSSSMTPLLNGTTWYRVKVTKSKDGCTSLEKISNAVKVTANSLSAPTVSIISASYNMNAGTFTVSGRLDHAGCSNDIYVGYRYKLSNDDTWSDLINTHHLTGNDAVNGKVFTKADITIAGATAGQTYLFQTYAINGHPNYQEISAVLSSYTKEVEVQDGYTVYVRRPQSGDATNVYTNWYELSSVKGGAPYVKSGAITGSSSNNQATTNNTGGTEMTYAFTDCDGYVWDSFKPAKGQTQFHVRALNNDAQNGWGTFSQTANIVDGKDNYFYLKSWASGQYGVTIAVAAQQPTRGVRIKALGSAEVISNNMASFAAISFAGNCTGKELLLDADKVPTGFQWKYSAPGTSSWSNYDGEGATWNNIRPTAAGKYKLVCTMEDNTTVESNEVTITTTSKSYNATDLINIKSALPIIMVNTGDNNGFPACSVAGSDYPSKHADKFKKKLSVDVKIKVGDDIVYDKKARMAYRGSSSLNFEKKSYAFCPGADMCGLDEDKSPDFVKTKKIDMLSLITGGTKTSAKDKDWVLYAATPDPSMMRNILAMETFSAMTGKWGVKNQYVELYVDGVYQGVYVFMDKITQNKGRVNVEWEVDGSSKGFIVKFDKTDLADRYEIPNGDQKTFESAMKTGNTGVISYGTEIDQRFEIEYPEKEDVIDDGGSWADVYTFVKGKIDAFESALKDGDFNTVRTIIDYESWADFFVLTEFAKNGDGYRASCVFVYEGGLLKAYPLWDYELSFDNETRQEHSIDITTGLLAKQTTYSKVSGENGTFPAPFWWTGNYYNQKTYKGLLDDPCFVAMVKARWEEHTGANGALSKTKMQALVSAYNAALTTTDGTTTYNTPQKREAYKWPYNGTTRGKTCNNKDIGYYGQGAGSASSVVEDFSGSKSTLDTWIGDSGRRNGLKTEIDNLAEDITFAITVVADKTTTTPWRPVTVTVNSNSGYEYSITPEPAKVEENGHMYTLYFARPERTEGQNFTTIEDAYTFTATTGQADQCGTTQGSTTSAEVKIDLADVEENCD